MNDLNKFIGELETYLDYKKESGDAILEISSETLVALKTGPAVKKESAAAKAPSSGSLDAVAARIAQCTNCPLHASRKNTVPGEGNPDSPDIMFIGEGPGAEEDAQGRPFVGEAGRLLDKMIAGMSYQREEVFIANIVKCRPTNNRAPTADEMDACLPCLREQIALIQPKIIVALGKTAVEGLLQKKVAITRFRGTWCIYEGIDLMPTYHPAFLLRSPSHKGEAWTDLKTVLKKLGRQVPPKK